MVKSKSTSQEFNEKLNMINIGEYNTIKESGQINNFKLNDKRTVKENEDIEKVKRELVNRMQNQKLEFFSISHYSKVARASIIEVNEK